MLEVIGIELATALADDQWCRAAAGIEPYRRRHGALDVTPGGSRIGTFVGHDQGRTETVEVHDQRPQQDSSAGEPVEHRGRAGTGRRRPRRSPPLPARSPRFMIDSLDDRAVSYGSLSGLRARIRLVSLG